MPDIITAEVTLETPIQRGETIVTKILVRKPQGGELRGASLVNLINMDYASLETVLPRITQPALTVQDIRGIDPADLVQLATEVSSFLLTKRDKGSFPTA